MGKDLSGILTANYPQLPEPSCRKETLFPTQFWISSPLASTTCPVPYSPMVAGRGTGK